MRNTKVGLFKRPRKDEADGRIEYGPTVIDGTTRFIAPVFPAGMEKTTAYKDLAHYPMRDGQNVAINPNPINPNIKRNLFLLMDDSTDDAELTSNLKKLKNWVGAYN